MNKKINVGIVLGDLTVVCKIGEKKYKSSHINIWLCKCKCGLFYIRTNVQLLKKVYYHKDIHEKKIAKSETRLYKIRKGILDRCLNKKRKEYKDYGGRGIKICDEWKKNFNSFYEWSIKNGYDDNLTIDRIDVNGNYEPSNCRWVDRKTQMRNRRNNIIVYIDGHKYNLFEVSKKYNVPYNLILSRLRRKWNIHEIIKTPKLKSRWERTGYEGCC